MSGRVLASLLVVACIAAACGGEPSVAEPGAVETDAPPAASPAATDEPEAAPTVAAEPPARTVPPAPAAPPVEDAAPATDYTVTLLSVTPDGEPVGGSDATITPDGRFVAFRVNRSDLFPDPDAPEAPFTPIFVWERGVGLIDQLGLRDATRAGERDTNFGPTISDDGRFVAFAHAFAEVRGDDRDRQDVVIVDRWTRETTVVGAPDGSAANGFSFAPMISGDGSVVVFGSSADNLGYEDHNGDRDVFAYWVQEGRLELISRTPEGTTGAALSWNAILGGDGLTVVFASRAPDLLEDALIDGFGWFVAHLGDGTLERAADWTGRDVSLGRTSPDGRWALVREQAVRQGTAPLVLLDRERGTLTPSGIDPAEEQVLDFVVSPHGEPLLLTERAGALWLKRNDGGVCWGPVVLGTGLVEVSIAEADASGHEVVAVAGTRSQLLQTLLVSVTPTDACP